MFSLNIVVKILCNSAKSHMFGMFEPFADIAFQNPILDSPIPWESPSAAIRRPFQQCVAQISMLATTKTHMVKHVFCLP